MGRSLPVILLVAVLIASTPALATPQGATSAADHWALDWGHYDKADVSAAAHGAIVCMLGDVDADGVDDILLRAQGEADAKLVALSGADPDEVLWESALDATARLECAADTGGDGVADPLVILEEATGSGVPADGAPVSSEEVMAHLQALDGVSGKEILSVDAAQSATSGDAAAVSGSSATDVTLQPGGEKLYLLVSREETSTVTEVLDDLSLSSEDTSLEIHVLDASGEVTGVIETPPQADVLGHAVVVNDKGASILILTATDASPIEEAPAQVPTLTAYATDASVKWTAELEATAQNVMLVPHAGDVDADGVDDIILQSVPTGLDLPSSPTLTVVSGASGDVILERTADDGLLAALPLGDTTPTIADDADALLVITQAADGAPVMLECVQRDVTCWTAELPAGGLPVNADTDEFTGDIAGFHDLTGDGVPDVATLVEEQDAAALSVLDGTDGSVAWSSVLDSGSQVVPVPSTDGVDLAVLGPFEEATRQLDVSLIEGVDGTLAWTATATVSASLDDAHAHLESAHDGETLLLTIGDEHAYALDAITGETLWSGTALVDGEAPADLELTSVAGVPKGVAAIPAPGIALLAVAVGALALARRRV